MKKTHKIILGSVGACAMVAAVLSLTLVDCEGKDDDFNATPAPTPVAPDPVTPEPEPVYTVCPAGEVKVATPNGTLIWAGSNLSGYQVFADNYYDWGCLFQWGSKTVIPGNPTSGDDTVQVINDGAANPDGTWLTANDPCPMGWRLPTSDEWAWLINKPAGNVVSIGIADGTYTGVNVWTTGTGAGKGFKVVTKALNGVEAGQELWFPNAGIRTNNGTSNARSVRGYVWSSDQNNDPSYTANAFHLVFLKDPYQYGSITFNSKLIAMSVRCVR